MPRTIVQQAPSIQGRLKRLVGCRSRFMSVICRSMSRSRRAWDSLVDED
ncbi:hypothetical protein X777_03363 [Ooceraea biroi]|uniref:Uncharacterized protein n=1 Tax=Ooceraea biroi TaxID=2015173 RepID=A0A026X4J2_OOCBI|nr:hypothetical protein X777_03363 [Ooceraea biroi]